MSRATPCFRTAIHLLEKAKAFFQIIPGEEHHASWNQQLVHPDAALIADAPAILARCKELEALLVRTLSTYDCRDMMRFECQPAPGCSCLRCPVGVLREDIQDALKERK